MAVLECRCHMIVSTTSIPLHCPRCRAVLVMSDQIEIPVNRRHPQKEKPEEMTDSPTNRSNLAPENSSHFTLFQISPPNADKNQSALSRCDFPKPGQASIV